jgi:hypothetical protein
VTEVHRKLELTLDRQLVECLVKRQHVVVLEPARDYDTAPVIRGFGATQGREMPFCRVEITTLLTPALLGALDQGAFFPDAGSGPFKFHVQALDRDRQPIDFSIPLLFIPVGRVSSAIGLYNAIDPKDPHSRRTCDLRGQSVAFAPSNNPGDTHLKATDLRFQVRTAELLNPPFLPMMELATVSVPAIDRLLASSGVPNPPAISFHDAYLAHGFDPVNNRPEAFATLDVTPDAIPGVTRKTPLSLAIPADKAGGIAAPAMSLDGLSRALGPVSSIDNHVKAGALLGPGGVPTNPQAFQDLLREIVKSLGGGLLGGIALNEVISIAAAAADRQSSP